LVVIIIFREHAPQIMHIAVGMEIKVAKAFLKDLTKFHLLALF